VKKGWVLIRGFGLLHEQITSTLSQHPILKDFTLTIIKTTIDFSKDTFNLIKTGFLAILPLIDNSNSELTELSKIQPASNLLFNELTYKEHIESIVKDYLSSEIATRFEHAITSKSLNRSFENYLYIKQKILTIKRLIDNNALIALDYLDKEYMEKNINAFMTFTQDSIESAVNRSDPKIIKNGYDCVKRNKRCEELLMKVYTEIYKKYVKELEKDNLVEMMLKLEEKLEAMYRGYNVILQWSVKVHCEMLSASNTLNEDVAKCLNNLLTTLKHENSQQRIERVFFC